MSSWLIAGITTVIMLAGILVIVGVVVYVLPENGAPPWMIFLTIFVAGTVAIFWVVIVLETVRVLLLT